jgi:hypothetical protein
MNRLRGKPVSRDQQSLGLIADRTHSRCYAALSQHAPNSHRPRHPGSGMNEMLPRPQLQTDRKARDLTEPFGSLKCLYFAAGFVVAAMMRRQVDWL